MSYMIYFSIYYTFFLVVTNRNLDFFGTNSPSLCNFKFLHRLFLFLLTTDFGVIGTNLYLFFN
jgi:hypothetical protein